MSEKRNQPRQRALKSGTIKLGRLSTFSCVIRNYSERGACLEIDNAHSIPNDFTLEIQATKRSCHVKWRAKTRLGVVFA